MVGDGEPEEIRVNRVTEGFFEMMRVQPMSAARSRGPMRNPVARGSRS